MRKIFLWGGKLKARLADYMIAEAGDEVALIFDPGLNKPAFETPAHFLADPAILKQHISACTHFVVCIGADKGFARTQISNFCLNSLGLQPLPLIHPSAYVSQAASIGKGFQAMPHAVVHHFSTVGDWSIVNTNAHIDHECIIGTGVHIMGGAALAGEVMIGDYASIGTNATILPGIKIGANSYVGAGAVVTKNVGEKEIVTGVPARYSRTAETKFDETIFDKILD